MPVVKVLVVGNILDGKIERKPIEGREKSIHADSKTKDTFTEALISYAAYVNSTSYKNNNIVLEITSTVGTEEHKALRKDFYAEVGVAVIVFSLYDKSSFEAAKNTWVPEVENYCRGVPVVLVGVDNNLLNISAPRFPEIAKKHISDYVENMMNDSSKMYVYQECKLKAVDAMAKICKTISEVAKLVTLEQSNSANSNSYQGLALKM